MITIAGGIILALIAIFVLSAVLNVGLTLLSIYWEGKK